MKIYLNKNYQGSDEIRPYVFKALKPTSKVGAWYFSNRFVISYINTDEDRNISIFDIIPAGFLYITEQWKDVCNEIIRQDKYAEEHLNEYLKHNLKHFQGQFLTQSPNYVIKDCEIKCVKQLDLKDIFVSLKNGFNIGGFKIRNDYKILQYYGRGKNNSKDNPYDTGFGEHGSGVIRAKKESVYSHHIQNNVATIIPRTKHNKLGIPIKVFTRKAPAGDKDMFYFNYAK